MPKMICNTGRRGCVCVFFVGAQAMKAFIETTFRMIDIDGDGVVGQPEFVLNCIARIAVDDVKLIQNAYQNLLNVRNLSLTNQSTVNFK